MVFAIDFDGDGLSDQEELAVGRDPNNIQVVQFPFVESFEDADEDLLRSNFEWNVISGDLPEVIDDIGVDGSKGVSAEGSDLLAYFDDTQDDNVLWTDMMIRPVLFTPGASPDVSGGTAAAFFFNTNQQVEVRDGEEWKSIDLGFFDPNVLHHVAVLNDYKTQLWSLWVDGVEVGSNLNFAFSNTYYGKIRFRNSAAVVDNVTVRNAPLVGGYEVFQRTLTLRGATEIDPEGDADRDGLSNLVEYAIATNPLQADLGNIRFDNDSNRLVYLRNTLATDVILEVEFSDTLLPNSWSLYAEESNEIAFDNGTVDEVSFDVPEAQNGSIRRRFWRLKIIQD